MVCASAIMTAVIALDMCMHAMAIGMLVHTCSYGYVYT